MTPILPLVINSIVMTLASEIRQEKEIKDIRLEKEETQFPLFTENMIT